MSRPLQFHQHARNEEKIKKNSYKFLISCDIPIQNDSRAQKSENLFFKFKAILVNDKTRITVFLIVIISFLGFVHRLKIFKPL
jgi:hypothetical protein